MNENARKFWCEWIKITVIIDLDFEQNNNKWNIKEQKRYEKNNTLPILDIKICIHDSR